jgi:hypothetical protein
MRALLQPTNELNWLKTKKRLIKRTATPPRYGISTNAFTVAQQFIIRGHFL